MPQVALIQMRPLRSHPGGSHSPTRFDLPPPVWYDGSGIEGQWTLSSGIVDGEIVEGLLLEIDAETAAGKSTCNSFSFDRRTRSGSTPQVGCLPEPGEPDPALIEEAIFGVIQNGPTLEGDLLVFRAGDVELIYQRSTTREMRFETARSGLLVVFPSLD